MCKYMTKQDNLTGYHVKIMIWFLSTLFLIGSGLIVYIWQDQKADNTARMDLIQETLDNIIETNSLQDKDISAIKEWQRLWEQAKEKGNTRGGSSSQSPNQLINNIQYVPDETQVADR